MRWPAAVLAASGAAVLCACGPGERALQGSLSEVLDLRFNAADVVQSDRELSLRFLWKEGTTEDVVLRVTASTLGTSVDAQKTLDLAEEDPSGRQRGRVTRLVQDDPLTTLPPLRRGGLTFQRSLIPGQTVPGELHITFAQGTDLASGRTVFGTFEATLP